MRMRTVLLAILLALLFTLAACGGSSGPTSLDDGDGPPGAVASVEIVEGDSLSVLVQGVSDTVTAVLRDSAGNPVPGDLASWDVNGGSQTECGFWTASSLQANADGEVKNTMHGGEVAHTASGAPDCTYRVVHSSQGAPEPVVDSVAVTIQPGPPASFRHTETEEDSALAQLTILWRDRFRNPARYEASVLSGPARVDSAVGPDWTRSIEATGVGSGEVVVWSLPDSSRSLDGTFEVTDAGGYLWICVQLPDSDADDDTTVPACEGPPTS